MVLDWYCWKRWIGVCCIGFACPCGLQDLISDGKTGLLIEKIDENAMVVALERLIGSSTFRQQFGKVIQFDIGLRYSHPHI